MDYAPSIEGGLPLAAPASNNKDRRRCSQFTPVTTSPRAQRFFTCFAPTQVHITPHKHAGDTGSRALTPPVVGQGAVFIGVVLLKSRMAVIITYLF